MTFAAELKTMAACADAVTWVGRRSLKTAWAECERADWLLWYAARRDVARPLLVRAACACARTSLHLAHANEHCPRIAIETAEAWCEGKATIEQVLAAADAARAAAYAAYAASYAASGAARAAAYAADVARAASYAAYAAYFAADAVGGASGDVDAARRQMAGLVRGIIRLEDLR